MDYLIRRLRPLPGRSGERFVEESNFSGDRRMSAEPGPRPIRVSVAVGVLPILQHLYSVSRDRPSEASERVALLSDELRAKLAIVVRRSVV